MLLHDIADRIAFRIRNVQSSVDSQMMLQQVVGDPEYILHIDDIPFGTLPELERNALRDMLIEIIQDRIGIAGSAGQVR